MSPISYQGPMAEDEKDLHKHSQTKEGSLGEGQPGLTVEAILGHKGDDVYTVTPHTTVKEVVAELARLRVGALLVVNSSNEAIGIVSERDVVRKADSDGLEIFEGPVENIMTSHPQTCSSSDKIEDIAHRMLEGHFRHFPVIKDGKPCGLISIGDVVRHRLIEIEYESLKLKQAMVG